LASCSWRHFSGFPTAPKPPIPDRPALGGAQIPVQGAAHLRHPRAPGNRSPYAIARANTWRRTVSKTDNANVIMPEGAILIAAGGSPP
jgi:hypothetical protein